MKNGHKVYSREGLSMKEWLDPKLVEYLQQLIQDKGLEYVKTNKQLLLLQWEHIKQLGT